MATRLGYPYLRGEGRVAKDGRTWLSRVTKTDAPDSPALFVGWDQAARKWVIEKDTREARNPDLPEGDAQRLVDSIRHGDKVTILVPAGFGRGGQEWKPRTGRAVMRGPAGWVLNLGGAHGTPGIASSRNIVSVRRSNPEKTPRPRKGESVPDYHARRVHELLAKMPKAIRDVFDHNPAEYKFIFRNASEGAPRSKKENAFWRDYFYKKAGLTLMQAQRAFALHWKGSSPETAIHLAKQRSNPDDGELEAAEELFETFHGREPREILEMQESSEMRGEYAALGDLVELTMIAPNGNRVKVNFKNDGVRVASSPDAAQLYLLGGNQDISGNLEMFGADESKDLIDLGEAKQIVYDAAKWQTNFDPQEWKHDFGEESGVRPRGFYDQLKKRIFFAGGTYKVERPGIVD